MKNEKIEVGSALRNIAGATVTSFTICVLCWSVFWLLPDWDGTGAIGTLEVVSAVWVSLGICLCMSALGFVCFSEAFARRAGKLARYLVFAVLGYGVIAAWVFGSGWCPMEGFGLFTAICAAALAFAGVVTFVGMRKTDAALNRQLDDFKRS